MRFLLLTLLPALLLTGCYTLNPEENARFGEPLPAAREQLTSAPEVRTERDNLRLVATAFSEAGLPVYYYTERRDAREAIIPPERVKAIAVLRPSETDGSGALEDLPPGSAEFTAALRQFPRLSEYRELKKGYEEPEEEERSVIYDPYAAGALSWEFRYRLQASGATGEHGPLTVRFSLTGSDEEDTRFVGVTLATGDRRVTVRLDPHTVRMREGMTPEMQRLARAVSWDGDRRVVVFDRIVDLETGAEEPLLYRVPSTYLDHLTLSPNWDRALFVLGSYRITKRTFALPVQKSALSGTAP